MQRQVSLTVMTAALLLSFSEVKATENSLTLGYNHGQISSKSINGLNVKYRYESNRPLGVIGSFSYLSGRTGRGENNDGSSHLKSWSLMAGPGWRFNEFFSLYGMAGISTLKQNRTQTARQKPGSPVSGPHTDNFRSASPVIGLGAQYNPLSTMVIDLSYEMARPKVSARRTQLNSIVLGAGLKF